ncbi:MAG: Asd/ArgC dimerization domain-containing protein [Thermoanaerobaculia bacterium]
MKLAKDTYRIAIVNPLTLVGTELKTILHDRGLHYSEIELIDTTGADEGTLTEVDDAAAFVTEAREGTFEGLDFVFFCGPREANQPWIARAAEDGFTAIDLSQPAALEGEGLTVVSGINDADLADEHSLVVSPHPIATTLIILLDALRKRFPIRLCAAAVIQPASELDKKGVDELFQQTIGALNLQAMPKEVFDRQLAFNLYPAPDATSVSRYVIAQIRTVLGGTIPVTLSITQGTVFHGHSFSIFLQLPQGTAAEDVTAALEASSAIATALPDESYSTVDAAGKDQILVGQITADPNIDGGFWLWAVVDNLRRSTALNAVLAVEAIINRLAPAN